MTTLLGKLPVVGALSEDGVRGGSRGAARARSHRSRRTRRAPPDTAGPPDAGRSRRRLGSRQWPPHPPPRRDRRADPQTAGAIRLTRSDPATRVRPDPMSRVITRSRRARDRGHPQGGRRARRALLQRGRTSRRAAFRDYAVAIAAARLLLRERRQPRPDARGLAGPVRAMPGRAVVLDLPQQPRQGRGGPARDAGGARLGRDDRRVLGRRPRDAALRAAAVLRGARAGAARSRS